jgi:4-aminobutyrate aminotransferase
MAATEFTKKDGPDKDTAKVVQQACLADNLLLLTCGTYENVIRWIPPLIVTEEQVEDALSIFAQALEKA